MSIAERIKSDLVSSMKAKDELRTATLRMIRSEILLLEKSGHAPDDAQIVKALQRMIKQRHEAAEQFDRGGRTEAAEKERAEAALIAAYLPQALSEEEVHALIEAVVAEVSACSPKDAGRVTGLVVQRAKATGKIIDGAAVNALVRARLGG